MDPVSFGSNSDSFGFFIRNEDGGVVPVSHLDPGTSNGEKIFVPVIEADAYVTPIIMQ
jgi:hypothetical protein